MRIAVGILRAAYSEMDYVEYLEVHQNSTPRNRPAKLPYGRFLAREMGRVGLFIAMRVLLGAYFD